MGLCSSLNLMLANSTQALSSSFNSLKIWSVHHTPSDTPSGAPYCFSLSSYSPSQGTAPTCPSQDLQLNRDLIRVHTAWDTTEEALRKQREQIWTESLQETTRANLNWKPSGNNASKLELKALRKQREQCQAEQAAHAPLARPRNGEIWFGPYLVKTLSLLLYWLSTWIK